LWRGFLVGCSLGALRRGRKNSAIKINPTHTHDNIAVDARSGKVWVRDHHGHQAIFAEIVKALSALPAGAT
jgi:hypothetical protein